ncbi:hypothetical protein DRN86_03785, partial [Candidatus Geothermarchaeota archaeon]
KPGIKGWELKRLLGKNYLKILDILKTELERIGLTIKVFFEESEEKNFSKATFYVVLKEHPSFVETRAFGMRIDDLAALAASIVYILSRGGKAPSKEVEKMLAKKIIKTRVSYLVDKFIKMGYLSEDEKGMLYLGWRTLVEVNRENLLSMIFAKSSSESAKE